MNGSYPVHARLARRYNRRWLLHSGLAVGSAALALACAGRKEQAKTVPTSPSPAAPATAAGAVTPRRGGRFLGYVDLTVTSHNPIIDYGQTQLHPSHVYDRLVNYRFVDKQQYLNLLHGGRGQVAPGVLTPAFTEYLLDPKQTEKYFRNDLHAARQLIEAAGFDLSREVEIGSYERPAERQGLEIFQQQASKVGLKVRTITMPLGEWNQQKIATGNWEITYGTGAAYDSPQVPLRFHHTVTNSLNRYSGLKDPEVDRMIERAEQTLDRQERVKLIKDIQIALLEKYTPIIVTHSPMQYVAVWRYVRDYEISPVSLAMYQTKMWLDK